jgi:excisionase family DNA binding protein
MAAILKQKAADPPVLIGLNGNDAARSIGISKDKLYELANAGEIPCVRLNRQTLIFDPKDLADWINKNKSYIAGK